VEESKKIKEKKKEAVIIDNKQMGTEDLKKDEKKSTQDLKEEKRPSVCGYDYCATSQPLPNYSSVNNAAVELALKMTEKALKDPFFPVDLDTYCSLDMLNGKSK
jgi:hypothetical protein